MVDRNRAEELDHEQYRRGIVTELMGCFGDVTPRVEGVETTLREILI